MSNTLPQVDVLLAAFNGEKYLRAQLESLQAQSYQNWKLYLRDDGSTDSTRELLEEFALLEPRVAMVDVEHPGLGPSQSFSRLLTEFPTSRYLMFCDQDD